MRIVAPETLEARLTRAIRDIPDFPRPGIVFKDITPVLLDPRLFDQALEALVDWTRGREAQKVAGIEARGFLFAAPLADRLDLPLVPIRKMGKLPSKTHRESYSLEYGESTLEVHVDAVTPGERIVLVDDLLATGGTTRAATRLVERLGGTVAGLGFVVELAFLNGRRLLDGYECLSLVRFGDSGESADP